MEMEDRNEQVIPTSGDHLVLMGTPAKFTTPFEPRILSFHSGSSAITIPGNSLTTSGKEHLQY